MTKENSTEILIILDRSGSMASIKTDMEGGFATFLEEQRKLPGECKVTLVQFDHAQETVYESRDIMDVPPLELAPRGGTALLDAVASTIDATGARLRRMPEAQRPGKILCLIITDGAENASKEFTAAQVKTRIEHQRTKYAWEFVYLGANQDAFAEAQAMGINFAGNYAATAKGVGDVFRGVVYASNSTRSGEQLTSHNLATSMSSGGTVLGGTPPVKP